MVGKREQRLAWVEDVLPGIQSSCDGISTLSGNAGFVGKFDADFSKYANLSDLKVKEMAVHGMNPRPIPNPKPASDFKPKDPRFNDNDGRNEIGAGRNVVRGGHGMTVHSVHPPASVWAMMSGTAYTTSASVLSLSKTVQSLNPAAGGFIIDRRRRSMERFNLIANPEVGPTSISNTAWEERPAMLRIQP